MEHRMRCILTIAGACLLVPAVHAQSLAATCHASTSYDITLAAGSVQFDRAQPAPRRVEMHDGQLRVDGAQVALGTEDSDRVALFEQDVRALEPRVKAVAVHGVDLAVDAIRQQARQAAPQAAASGELDARLDAQARAIKARIAASHSTRDWQGAAFDRYVDNVAADIVPLLAGDLAQQALSLAISGDLAGAAALRGRTASLLGDTQARVRQRLQALRPQLQALCPDIRRLDAIESGIGARPGGSRLDLIDIAG
jgi:hypothetical protein